MNPRFVHAAKVHLTVSEPLSKRETYKRQVVDELCATPTRYHQQLVIPAWNTIEAQSAKAAQTALLEHLHHTDLKRRERDPYDIEYDRGKLKKVWPYYTILFTSLLLFLRCFM
jgi:hypothetical protein